MEGVTVFKMKAVLTVFLLVLLRNSVAQKEGESCVQRKTSIVGRCVELENCTTGDDLDANGMWPTYCNVTTRQVLVCCKNDSIVVPTTERSGTIHYSRYGPDTRRVSVRKCQEYSQIAWKPKEYLPGYPPVFYEAKCDFLGLDMIFVGNDGKLGEFPHMAAIGWAESEGGYTFHCSGSLISPRFVLTAGRCIKHPKTRDASPAIARLGIQNLNSSTNAGGGPKDVPIKATHKHPDFQPPMRYNDIALLELAEDVDFNDYIRAACLWDSPNFRGFIQYSSALLTGWGVNRFDNRTQLLKTSMELLENGPCDEALAHSRSRLWNGLAANQMCAIGSLRHVDACQSNQGSPLQVPLPANHCIFYVMGVMPHGFKCAGSRQPTVFTRVSSYLEWIESVVWPGE